MTPRVLKILFKFPTRGRPDKFFEVLDAYYKLLDDKDSFRFLISLDSDDPELKTYISKLMSDNYPNLVFHTGTSKNKIDAINRDVNLYQDWDICVVIADDMVPQIEGYDNIIRMNMLKAFPDTDGILFFNDGYTQLNTLPILGRKYYNRFGYIYCPEYASVFADNEFQEVAKILGRQVYNDMVVIKHNHPRWTGEAFDELYTKNESLALYKQDEEKYRDRLLNNFHLDLLEAKADGPTISLCMIVKNELQNMQKHLPNVLQFADEICIVDTGSTDGTLNFLKEVAKEYPNVKIKTFEWCNDFAKARNISLEMATCDYIWWLDADDELPFMSYNQAKHHLKKNKDTALMITLVSIQNEGSVYSGQLRVFPNKPEIRFKGRVHEQIMWAIKEKELDINHLDVPLFHYGYTSNEILYSKLLRNIEILQQQEKDGEMDFNSYLAYSRSLAGIGQFPQALESADKCLEEWKKAPHLITRDFLIMAFLTKASVLDALGHTEEAIITLDGVNKIYPKDKTVCLALAEKFHRKGDYEKIYENLVGIRNEKYPIGFFPINTTILEKEERHLLLLASLAVGDFSVAEECLRKQTGDANFTIKRPERV